MERQWSPRRLPSGADAQAGHTAGWRAAFAATLLLAMAAGTLVQFVVGVLAPFVRADLGLSRAQVGALVTVFFAVGAVGSPVAGPVVDRIGGRRMLIATFLLSGTGLLAMGASWAYGGLVGAMVVAGLGTALVNPVTNRLIAVHLARGRQGVVTGIKQSGVQVGAFLAGVALPAVALAAGWRVAVIVTAAVALAGVVPAWIVVPGGSGGGGSAPPPDGRRPMGAFVRWLAAYAFLMGAGVAAVGSFLVLYAVEDLGFSEGRAGLAAALVGGVGAATRILWGRAAERMRTSSGPLLALALASVAAQVLVWSASADAEWLLWVGAAAFGATAASWNAVGMLAIVREVDLAGTGRASGIVQAAFYVGLVVTPVAFGASVDATSGYDLGWAGVTAAFAAATALVGAWHLRERARLP